MSILRTRNRGGSMYQETPDPGGMNAQQATSIYDHVYGKLPVPATAYVMSSTPLRSVDVQPSVRTVASNASVVNRADRKDGMVAVGGKQSYYTSLPQRYDSPASSWFQANLVGPIINFSQNLKWYIAYPAASVMLGGMHNMAWSEMVPQLQTNPSGGPGPGSMSSAPRFKSVQTIPRYSTMPSTYNTSGTSQ